jgi:hypothetical protein
MQRFVRQMPVQRRRDKREKRSSTRRTGAVRNENLQQHCCCCSVAAAAAATAGCHRGAQRAEIVGNDVFVDNGSVNIEVFARVFRPPRNHDAKAR